VIFDSWHIKEDVSRALAEIEECLLSWSHDVQDKHPASQRRALLTVTREVLWIAFAIRKLMDSKKLSDELEAEPFSVGLHPRRPTTAFEDQLSMDHIERFYDLGSVTEQTLRTRDICNQLIHSFQLQLATNAAGRQMRGLYVNSDRTRTQGLYFVAWEEFTRLVRATSTDDIADWHFNRITGEQIKRRYNPVPREA
jgi:hypothetical protein